MRKRKGLVAKSLDKIACYERLWNAYIEEHPLAAKSNFPPLEHVVQFAAWTTRTRKRACLAQRDASGPERKGLARHTTRLVLNNLNAHVWDRRYPVFARLPGMERKSYWVDVMEQFLGMHKLSLQPILGVASEERAAQVAAQTAPVTQRKNFYRTEVHQLQDWCLEQQNVNSAMLLDAGMAIVQTTAARPGMFAKDRWDKKCARWSKQNPLRVRDVKYSVETLCVEREDGQLEGTSHMQINWRRVKLHYWQVYFFRASVTANDQSAMRRATVRLTTLLIRTGRFRACRAGLSVAEVQRQLQSVNSYRGLRLVDTM